jgi:hypothetical protein
MKFDVKMAVRHLMTIGSSLQVILRIPPQKFERPLFWCYRRREFMNYGVEMISGGMEYIPNIIYSK